MFKNTSLTPNQNAKLFIQWQSQLCLPHECHCKKRSWLKNTKPASVPLPQEAFFHSILCQAWWGPANSREWSNSPRRRVAETRLAFVHPRPIQTIQSVSTQACDSVCRLRPNNEGFPASAVRKSHSPQPLHPDRGGAIFTQPAQHKENSLCVYIKGRFFHSGRPRPVMEENMVHFWIIPVHGANHLAMPMLCGWKHIHPSWGTKENVPRGTKEKVHVLFSILYTKLESLCLDQVSGEDNSRLWPPHFWGSSSHSAQIWSQGRAHWIISPACTSGHQDMGGGRVWCTHLVLHPTWKEAIRST